MQFPYKILCVNKNMLLVAFVEHMYLSNRALNWLMEKWTQMFLQISRKPNFEPHFW